MAEVKIEGLRKMYEGFKRGEAEALAVLHACIKDKRFKQVLKHIIEDERKHHKILQELSEILKKEAAEWNRYLYKMSTDFL